MAEEKNGRRDFFGAMLGTWAAIGGLGALYAAKRTWDPLPSVKAAGFTTIDLSNCGEDELRTEMWRGKPVFVMKVGKNNPSYDDKRLIRIGEDRFFVAIGLCTHLGCIPTYLPDKKKFHCPCHGGQFDAAGRVLKAPPPKPLEIPPFKIDGSKLVLGEEGEEYKKMKAEKLV